MSSKKYNLNRVIEKTDNSVTVEFSIPKESPYFDGHFPQAGILPGVAQVELVTFFAKDYFNKNISITKLKKVKFTNFIMPLAPLVLQLSKNDNKLTFNIKSADSEVVYSFGTLLVKE